MTRRLTSRTARRGLSLFSATLRQMNTNSCGSLVATHGRAVLKRSLRSVCTHSQRLRTPQRTTNSIHESVAAKRPVRKRQKSEVRFRVTARRRLGRGREAFGHSHATVRSSETTTIERRRETVDFLPVLSCSRFTAAGIIRPCRRTGVRSRLTVLRTSTSLTGDTVGTTCERPRGPLNVSAATSRRLARSDVGTLIKNLADVCGSGGGGPRNTAGGAIRGRSIADETNSKAPDSVAASASALT